jgi:hypothetical protein
LVDKDMIRRGTRVVQNEWGRTRRWEVQKKNPTKQLMLLRM